MNKYDAAIIGSGPNGLSSAIILSSAGLSVILIEANKNIGGGARTAELTLPGFKHDICSAVYPLAVSSPFFHSLFLNKYGLKWIYPEYSVVHPFDDGSSAFIKLSSIYETANSLGEDANNYLKIISPFVKNSKMIMQNVLSPLSLPSDLFSYINFGFSAIQSAYRFAKKNFAGIKAQSLFGGLSAHSILPLTKSFTAAFGLLLGISGHKPGWPIPEGGSQNIVQALEKHFRSLGGEIITGHPVKSLNDIPDSQIKVFDLTPRQILNIMGDTLPSGYKIRLQKYIYGPGVFKIDYALSEPVPFKSEECKNSATIHIGGTLEEIAISEKNVWLGKNIEKPFVIFVQPTLFDKTRAPKGKHTAWAYTHVPNGSTADMTELIEKQIEKFAPGFKNIIMARNTMNTEQLEEYNHNYVGGDINGGAQNWRQLVSRPVLSFSPYKMPLNGYYICSSSTPPGGGVHGMCGYNAAKKILKDLHIPFPVKSITN